MNTDNKIKFFAKLVSEIDISKYTQKEYLNIIEAIRLEIFDSKFGDKND